MSKISAAEVEKDKQKLGDAKVQIFGKNGCCKAILNRYGGGGWGADSQMSNECDDTN